MKKFVFKENKLGSGYLTPSYSKLRTYSLIKHSKGGRTHFGSYCGDYEEECKYDKLPKNKLFK